MRAVARASSRVRRLRSAQADGAAPNGVGPFYLDTTSGPNSGFTYAGVNYYFTPTATGFTDNGAGFGFGGFFNLDPGTYTVTTTDTAGDCEPVTPRPSHRGASSPHGAPHAMQVVVLKGLLLRDRHVVHGTARDRPVDGG